MNFTELVTEVKLWAKAPHMDGGIRSAIRVVTLKAHRKAKFWRDLKTVNVTGLTSDFVQQLDILTYFPNFRQLQSVEGCNLVEIGDLLDEFGAAKVNIALMAGTSLNIKRDTPIGSVVVSYWADPIVAPEESYSSWIAATQPDLIIAAAAARVLAWNAESEIYKAASTEEATQWLELLQNNVEGIGR
jgi:hypothetical protein